MPQGFAARLSDPVAHPIPPVLMPGPGALTVLIGMLPAWRGVPAAAAAAIQAAKTISDTVVNAAEAAAVAAAPTPGGPAARAAAEAAKVAASASMSSMIASVSMGADIHACMTPLPIPPHGPGVVIDGSPTVVINNRQACRMGDTIVEPLGPPNKIMMGCPTVIIGQGGGSASGGGGGPSAPAAPGQMAENPGGAAGTVDVGPLGRDPTNAAAQSWGPTRTPDTSAPSGGGASPSDRQGQTMGQAAKSGAGVVQPC